MSADRIETLQRYVDNFATDAGTIRAALRDDGTPDAAKRVLAGALGYVLDALDIFPDHYKGLGLADDALVFRVAAGQAVAAGAKHGGLAELADDKADVAGILGELAQPFDKFVTALADRKVRGRSAVEVLANRDLRAGFEADLDREIPRHKASQITHGPGGADGTLKELLKMTRASLKKAGLVA